MAYYYPEGYFGPICDSLVTQEEIADRSRPAVTEEDTDPTVDAEKLPDDFFDEIKRFQNPLPPFWTGRKCKERTLPDGTIELYDCENQFLGNYLTPEYFDVTDVGLQEDFDTPNITPDSCSPFDPDINIRPIIFYNPDGTQITKAKRQKSTPPTYPVESVEYWSTDGNTYGVWVNPEVCTLPEEQQSVTYLIDIPADDTYGFTFGCDDNATLFLNEEETPFLTAVGGIFASGANATPETGTRSLTAGTLKLIVNCTNSDAGFQDSNGLPTGLAYSWQRNPGGWYVKICRGGVCNNSATSQWVRSGPHPDWSTFMNTYSVYPSNTETLSGTTHTNTWTVPILGAGDYNLEVQGDNYCTFSWDGTSLGTIGQNAPPWGSAFTSSTNYTISNVSVGNHTLVATVLNGTGNNDWATNPGGVAFQLTSNISATFAANGDLVTTGSGSMEMTFDFVWSDNPNTWSQALGTYAISELGISFTQTSGVQSGAESKTVTVEGGKTYTCTITNNSGGFDRQNTNTKLCFKDLDGSDCNAALTFTTDNVIISSTDLSTPANNNLVWHTRMDTGYEYYLP